MFNRGHELWQIDFFIQRPIKQTSPLGDVLIDATYGCLLRDLAVKPRSPKEWHFYRQRQSGYIWHFNTNVRYINGCVFIVQYIWQPLPIYLNILFLISSVPAFLKFECRLHYTEGAEFTYSTRLLVWTVCTHILDI